jgi:uncharacterized protein YbjT (DUF2867 family)
MKIVVIGGTGLIGSKLVRQLGEQGHEAVAAAPASGVNTLTGEGLKDALDGAAVVVDVTNSPSFDEDAAVEFFETSTGHILDAEAACGVRHHVALSVVGSERLGENGYFRAKVVQEALIRNGSIPYSIVHATQFFEFLKAIADAGTEAGTVRIAPVRFQPMAAEDVARAVAKVAVGAPLNGMVEVGGPEQFRFDEFVREGLRALGDPREVVADPDARYYGYLVSERSLVPADGAELGSTRFDDWLRQNAKGA